ncbi:MAG TPA: hypothetical protein VIL10_09480, partial [Marmoricola sp.]
MADVFISVGAEADQASVDAAGTEAGRLFGKKFQDASKKSLSNSDALFKDIQATINRIKGLQANALKANIDQRQFEPLARGLERLLALQRQFAADRERLSKDTRFLRVLKEEGEAVKALTSSQTRELQSFVAASNIQERRKNLQQEKDLSLRNIQAQRDSQLQIN